MPRTTDARAKAIETAERLFRAQGYAATGLTQVIEESGSPKGSFYFHFPGGKRQLAEEALAGFRARTVEVFTGLADKANGNPGVFVRLLLETVTRDAAESGWQSNCLAQTLAQELAPRDEQMADSLAELFAQWGDIFTDALGGTNTAKTQAIALLASIEGARTLARTQRGPAAFEAVAASYDSLLRPNHIQTDTGSER